jgi:methylmalonyl-CoA epimerase
MKLDHVGIAVPSIEAALPFYTEKLGLKVTHREEVASQHVRVVFLDGSIELLEPTSEQGAIAKFLKTRGPGLHHVAFHADDIAGAMKDLAAKGAPALDAAPRPGSRGHKVCFLHPKHAHGVLVELVG